MINNTRADYTLDSADNESFSYDSNEMAAKKKGWLGIGQRKK